MRSIRLSLLVYFLALLALALAAFSFLIHENSRIRLTQIYETTRQMFTEESQRSRAVREDHYVKTRDTLKKNLDDALLLKAQTMASQLAESDIRPERVFAVRVLTPIMPTLLAPHGPGVPAYFAGFFDTELRHGWSSPRWTGRKQLDLAFVDDVLYHTRAERSPFVFQVYNEQGEIMARSRSLGEENLPLDKDSHELKLCEADFDDVLLPSGKKLRRVTIRVPITRLSVTRLWPSGDRRRQAQPALPGVPPTPAPLRAQTSLIPVDPEAIQRGDVPKVFLLYAKPIAEVEETLAELRAELDSSQRILEQAQAQTLEELNEQSRLALAALRTRLWLISLGVFGATVIGGVWVVRWALSPLERLTDAVSQVSERDFQLRIDPDQVPEELKPIVERLRQSLASLEQAFAREKQAAADISHDLRTPIASLLATTQVCLRRPRSSEEYREAIETCREIGAQLNTLVERLLALARLDAGADRLQTEPVDVPELAEQCVALIRPLAAEKGLSVHVERDGPILIETDAGKLREVLTNLLDNAIEYNRPHGRIDVVVSRGQGEVEVVVRDTGIGIAPEARQHLFERFYRVDPSRHTDTPHCGLGLAIVKGYVELMGGKVEVDSTPGQGSMFRVRLPLPAEESQDEASQHMATGRAVTEVGGWQSRP